MPATLPSTPTERLAAIIAGLASCVAEQGSLKRLAGPLLIAIWTRLHRISARFLAPPRRQSPAPAAAACAAPAPGAAHPAAPRSRAARRAARRRCPAPRAGWCA